MSREDAVKLLSKIPVSEICKFTHGDRRIDFMTNGTASCVYKALTVLLSKPHPGPSWNPYGETDCQ